MERPAMLNVQLDARKETQRIIVCVNCCQSLGQLSIVLDREDLVEVGVYLPFPLVTLRSEGWR